MKGPESQKKLSQPGFEPGTFGLEIQRAIHCATRTMRSLLNFEKKRDCQLLVTFLYHRDFADFFLLYNRFLELLSKASDQYKHISFTIEVFHVLRPINKQRSFLAGFFFFNFRAKFLTTERGVFNRPRMEYPQQLLDT